MRGEIVGPLCHRIHSRASFDLKSIFFSLNIVLDCPKAASDGKGVDVRSTTSSFDTQIVQLPYRVCAPNARIQLMQAFSLVK
jgi:hypothetical protein